MNPFEVSLDIINSDGKDEKNWKLLLPSINKEPTKNLKYLINEFFQYISNNNFNKEIIYDILDYIIDNYNNLEIKNSILDISILGLLSGIIQKKEVEKNVKIKILFLLQKWKNINENCLLIYNQIKSSNIILPPKGFQIVTYKKYLKQEIFNENNKSNFYGYNKLDNQENSNKNEYDNKKIIENDDDDFRLLKSQYLNDIPNSNQNNQNNNNYNNNLSKITYTSYASNSNYINNNISNPNNNDQINQNNNNLQNQNNNYNNQQNSTPNQNNNYQNHNYTLYNPSNQNNNNYQNQNNNYSNYNYLQNQNNNNRNYNIYPPNNYS